MARPFLRVLVLRRNPSDLFVLISVMNYCLTSRKLNYRIKPLRFPGDDEIVIPRYLLSFVFGLKHNVQIEERLLIVCSKIVTFRLTKLVFFI